MILNAVKPTTSGDSPKFSWKKPHIKKGYYPANLIAIKPFMTKDKILKEGKYGHLLIFEFAIYKSDTNDAPVELLKYSLEGAKEKSPIILPMFVYYEYKNKDGTYASAITPGGAITKTLVSLGWEFKEGPVDFDQFIGTWVEVNIDDYETKSDEEKYTASSIKGINPYKGSEIGKDIELIGPIKENQDIKKTIKHEEVEKKEEVTITKEELDKNINKIRELFKNKSLTEQAWKDAEEQYILRVKELNMLRVKELK